LTVREGRHAGGSLIDGDGVLTRMKIGDVSADWRLFNQ
jgi:hypothetical protein